MRFWQALNIVAAKCSVMPCNHETSKKVKNTYRRYTIDSVWSIINVRILHLAIRCLVIPKIGTGIMYTIDSVWIIIKSSFSSLQLRLLAPLPPKRNTRWIWIIAADFKQPQIISDRFKPILLFWPIPRYWWYGTDVTEAPLAQCDSYSQAFLMKAFTYKWCTLCMHEVLQ